MNKSTISKISLNIEDLEKSYLQSKGSFKHNVIRAQLFPFTTKGDRIVNENNIKEDLVSFKAIVGESYRLFNKLKLPKEYSKEKLISSIIENVETTSQDKLESIIKEVCFCGNSLYTFNSKAVLYQQFLKEHSAFKGFASLISDYFIPTSSNIVVEKQSSNVLYQLVNKALPELESKNNKENGKAYYHYSRITKQIVQDIGFLESNENLFIEGFDTVFSYYLFYYYVQLSFSLEQLFTSKDEATKIFYSVEWEGLSESRETINFGWKSIENKVSNIFSHTICLDLLHYIDGINSKLFTYKELKETIDSSTKDQKRLFISSVEDIYQWYISKVKLVKKTWNDFERTYNPKYKENESYEAVYKLYKAVCYQFENSDRHKAKEGYAEWLRTIGRLKYTRRRGRLGYTLSLNQEFLLIFIRLTIGRSKDKKIRLSELWVELEQRGISFDQFSREEIVLFLDKNNMLEKKSDSGDAQFVKLDD